LWCAPVATTAFGADPTATEAALLQRAVQRHGLALLLRHAQTDPGVGDPPGFRLGDCGTQRNLSEAGRAQAARIGDWLRRQQLRPTELRTSQWCRCQDTARLAGAALGLTADDWPALNSFFDDRSQEARQSAELRSAIARLQPGRLALWVTHQVNITAITGEVPAMGEAFAVGPAGGPTLGILSRLRFAA
jgi:phosphohistidine phosphatase SixA